MSERPNGRRRARFPRIRAQRLNRTERRYLLKRTVITFSTSRGVDSAAATSYSAALSVLPIALVAVSGTALREGRDHAVDRIIQIVDDVLQGGAPDVLRPLLAQLLSAPNPGIGLAVGIVLTVWTVGFSLTAFGRGVNALYGVQEGRLI